MSTNSNGTVPPWPSLYNPGLEILHIQHQPPVQPGGKYLYHANDVFRFTLYWTILFYIPPFLICGFYAFWNFAFPPWPKAMSNDVQMSVLEESVSPKPKSATYIRPVGTNEGRSRVTFAIIVFLIFISMSLAGAVIGSAILGFAAFGLYQSADFNMSTWIPFLLAVMYVLTGLLSLWPSIIEII